MTTPVLSRTSVPAHTGVVADAGRFLGAGLLNTVLTIVLYQLLLFVLSPAPAYALTWAGGLVFVSLVYPVRVFAGGRRGRGVLAATAGVYVVSFALGLGTITFLGHIPSLERAAILAALAFTTAFNFVTMRVIVRGIHSVRPDLS